jgi:hypothetical protein
MIAGRGQSRTPRKLKRSLHPIERALAICQQLQPRDQSVIVRQARKILTQRIYGMVDRGEKDKHRLTVGGSRALKPVGREHGVKSASGTGVCPQPHRRGFLLVAPEPVCNHHRLRKRSVHSEWPANLLIHLGANSADYSECALKSLAKCRILIPPYGGSNPPAPANHSGSRRRCP